MIDFLPAYIASESGRTETGHLLVIGLNTQRIISTRFSLTTLSLTGSTNVAISTYAAEWLEPIDAFSSILARVSFTEIYND